MSEKTKKKRKNFYLYFAIEESARSSELMAEIDRDRIHLTLLIFTEQIKIIFGVFQNKIKSSLILFSTLSLGASLLSYLTFR